MGLFVLILYILEFGPGSPLTSGNFDVHHLECQELPFQPRARLCRIGFLTFASSVYLASAATQLPQAILSLCLPQNLWYFYAANCYHNLKIQKKVLK